MDTATHPLSEAIRLLGLSRLAKELGVTYQAVRKWEAKRRLPRTEWTGETNYAERIEQLSSGRVTKQQLLEVTHLRTTLTQPEVSQ